MKMTYFCQILPISAKMRQTRPKGYKKVANRFQNPPQVCWASRKTSKMCHVLLVWRTRRVPDIPHAAAAFALNRQSPALLKCDPFRIRDKEEMFTLEHALSGTVAFREIGGDKVEHFLTAKRPPFKYQNGF